MEAVATGRGGIAFADGVDSRCLVGTSLLNSDRPGGGKPVTRTGLPDGSCPWVVTGYVETGEFLKDHRFSRARLSEVLPLRGPALQMSVTETDPPRHTQIRRLVSRAFSARRVEALRPTIESAAEALLGRLLKAGPVADLHSGFCAPLAFAAQCEVLGVPAGHRATLLGWSARRSGNTGPEHVYTAELQLHDRVRDMLTDPAAAPTGLLAELVRAHDAGALSGAELTGLAASLFFDGHLLAANQAINALLCLLTRPDQLGLLRAGLAAGPVTLDRAIEELLRYNPSITMSMPRQATEDLVLGGARVRAGEVVTAALPLVNRDPAVVAHPDRLDLTRPDAHHLSFGHGVHYCLGAHLTRVILRVALTGLLGGLPGLSLAVREADLSWFAAPNLRGLRALPVSWISCRRTPSRRSGPSPSSSPLRAC